MLLDWIYHLFKLREACLRSTSVGKTVERQRWAMYHNIWAEISLLHKWYGPDNVLRFDNKEWSRKRSELATVLRYDRVSELHRYNHYGPLWTQVLQERRNVGDVDVDASGVEWEEEYEWFKRRPGVRKCATISWQSWAFNSWFSQYCCPVHSMRGHLLLNKQQLCSLRSVEKDNIQRMGLSDAERYNQHIVNTIENVWS